MVTKTIDSEKMSGVLYDESRKVPEYMYVHLMNLLKRYHEFADNEDEIIDYISRFDKSTRSKMNAHVHNTCTCTCPEMPDENCRRMCWGLCIALMFLVGFGVVAYCVITSKRFSTRWNDLKNSTVTNINATVL